MKNVKIDIGKPCQNCGGPIKTRKNDRGWAIKFKKFCCKNCNAQYQANNRDNMKTTAGMRAAACSPEARAKRIEGLRNSPKRMLISVAAHTPEAIKKANQSRRKILGFQSVPENFSALWWRVRDYRGVIHEFKNLSWFIKENPDLFLPEDTKCPITRSRAYGGIRSLRPNPTRQRVNGSWKGWTWYSQTERLKNEGHDLLDREEL